MDLQYRGVTVLLLAIAALLILPTCVSQRVPRQQLQPQLPFLQEQEQQPFIPIPEFFCRDTPLAPVQATQAQCVEAFTAFNFQRNIRDFCQSVATFCTATHLTLCPWPATAAACRTCVPFFRQACQQG